MLLLLLLACLAILLVFRIRDVEVTGNSHYTEQQVKDMVMNDRYSGNALYLYLKYRYFNREEIPFVDKIEVSLLSNSKVRVRIY